MCEKESGANVECCQVGELGVGNVARGREHDEWKECSGRAFVAILDCEF